MNKSLNMIQIEIANRDEEMRRLVHTSSSAEDTGDREAARARLREMAASYRGFPGQRRRGEPPAGVELR